MCRAAPLVPGLRDGGRIIGCLSQKTAIVREATYVLPATVLPNKAPSIPYISRGNNRQTVTADQHIPRSTPRLRDTLSDDLRQKGFWKKVGREFDDIHGFYVPPEEQARLNGMSVLRRGFAVGWMMVKNMLLRLTPVRRLLLLAGILLIAANRIQVNVGDTRTGGDLSIIGVLAILFVLMLELKDRTLARDELEAGRKVQRALMASPYPEFPGWSIALFSRPANEVGGDLVDFIRVDEKRAAVVLADVSGKGLQAALLMAKLQATLRVLAQECASLGTCLSRANRVFHHDGIPGSFASLLSVEISTENGEVRWANAGHLPPFLVTAAGVQEMRKGEPALGLMGTTSYEEHHTTLATSDIFFVCSDGLTEARNEKGEFFGEERVRSLVAGLRGLTAEEITLRVTDEVDRFRGLAGAHDDLSFLVLMKT